VKQHEWGLNGDELQLPIISAGLCQAHRRPKTKSVAERHLLY
jgi:hypothetical protein